MQADKHLLEMAAKAAGLNGSWRSYRYCADKSTLFGFYVHLKSKSKGSLWNPLVDDGQCARLETVVGLTVDIGDIGVIASQGMLFEVMAKYADHDGDRDKARRFASVSAAAAIGEGMG